MFSRKKKNQDIMKGYHAERTKTSKPLSDEIIKRINDAFDPKHGKDILIEKTDEFKSEN